MKFGYGKARRLKRAILLDIDHRPLERNEEDILFLLEREWFFLLQQ